MKLRRPHRMTERETVVALIDVTFFLLVFFMMVGRLDATAPFAVLPPRGTTGTNLPGGGITLSVGTDGALALDGAPLAAEALPATVKARLARNPAALVRINADRGTPLRIILGLVNRLEDSGAKDVAIIVSPEVR
ncbi:biopolymer transporter ExbD [bacterium]|nr:biopolymer transporter ExbD [bacterium]